MGKLISILKLLPVLLAFVQSLEMAIKGEGKGSTRLDLLAGIIRDIYDTTPELQREFKWDVLLDLVMKIVGRIVGTFNAAGVFQTSGKALAPAPS